MIWEMQIEKEKVRLSMEDVLFDSVCGLLEVIRLPPLGCESNYHPRLLGILPDLKHWALKPEIDNSYLQYFMPSSEMKAFILFKL